MRYTFSGLGPGFVPSGGNTIVSHPTLSTNLVSYYKFDTDANDSVSSNNMSVSGATLTTGNGGKIGEAYDFDGTNDSLTHTGIGLGDYPTNWSFSSWIYLDTTGDWQGIIQDRPNGGTAGSIEINVNPSGNIRAITYTNPWGANSCYIATSTATITTGQWVHLVVTYDDTNFVISIDDIKETLARGSKQNNNAWGKFVGLWYVSPYYFDGKIDETGVWNKTLTSSEITDLYNSGSGLPYD
jgi:hypothetical protein